jgi:vitamin B12 transporter
LSWTGFTTDGQNIARGGDEADGFRNDALTLHGHAQLGDAFAVRGHLRYIDSEQEFDTQDFSFPVTATQGLVVDDDVASNMEQWFGRVEATAGFARTEHRFGVSGTRTENVFFDGGAATGSNAGDKTKLDYQLTLALGPAATDTGARRLDHALTVAFEREFVEYMNLGATADALENQVQADEQSSVVAEYRASFGRVGFSASARHDANELFEDAATYRMTGSFDVAADTRLHSSVGTGISNPGFFDLFGFFPGSFVGNPALEPERSTHFDVGIEHSFAVERARVDVTYFRADLEDEITTSFDVATFLSTVENLRGQSERRGVELSLTASATERWQVAAAYTYTEAYQPDGAPELLRPRHVASLDNTLTLAGGRARLNVGIDYGGTQIDNEFVFATLAERAVLPSFTLVNVAGDVRLNERWRLYGRVENLLDEEYEEWFSYSGRGRAVVAGFALELAP